MAVIIPAVLLFPSQMAAAPIESIFSFYIDFHDLTACVNEVDLLWFLPLSRPQELGLLHSLSFLWVAHVN
jgi:hypothetical protein